MRVEIAFDCVERSGLDLLGFVAILVRAEPVITAVDVRLRVSGHTHTHTMVKIR